MEQLPIYVGMRDVVDEKGMEVIHLECRFPDGQKYAPIEVEGDHQLLASLITRFLNTPDLVQRVLKDLV
jgi:hypothetical protein